MRTTIYEPLTTIRRLQDEMNRAFGSVLTTGDDNSNSAVSHWAPAVDVHEEADRYVIVADVPGVEPEEWRDARGGEADLPGTVGEQHQVTGVAQQGGGAGVALAVQARPGQALVLERDELLAQRHQHKQEDEGEPELGHPRHPFR